MSVNSLTTIQKDQLKAALNEINDSMTRMDAERDLIKTTINAMSEKLNLDKKIIKKLATTLHKSDFDEQTATFEEFGSFFEILFRKSDLNG